MAGGRVPGGGNQTVTGRPFHWLPAALRIILGAVFLYAGSLKIADPATFAGSIAAYRILPVFGNYLVAAILPWMELLCGLLLIVNYRVRAAALLVLCMNIVFVFALASAIARGLDIDCGCFRRGDAGASPLAALLRDLVLIAGNIFLLRLSLRQPPPQHRKRTG